MALRRTGVRADAGLSSDRPGPYKLDFQRYGPAQVWLSPAQREANRLARERNREDLAHMVAFEIYGDDVSRAQIREIKSYLTGSNKLFISPESVRARKKASQMGFG